MTLDEFDTMINKLNIKATVHLRSHDVPCRVLAHDGKIYIFEDGRKEPYTFDSIEEFRTRWGVFSDSVLYYG